MKYQCDKGHVFLFPVVNHIGTEVSWLEFKECPFCNELSNRNLSEYVEVPEELSDVISVPYEGVAVKLAEGYKVVEIYAKTITMKLPKPKSKNPDPDDNTVFMEQAASAYKTLEVSK
jgi:hypothetical protein